MPVETPVIPPTPFYRFVRTIVRGLIRLFGGISIRGSENIPISGPVILAPNHRANVDPPYLSLITSRQIYFMGKEELFRVPVLKQIIYGVGAFPVRRGAADRAALKYAVTLLKGGGVVLIFPEGTRTEDGNLQAAEKGFALIAKQADAAIVPVAIEGTERMLPKGAKLIRRNHVTVTIGVPLSVSELLAAKPETEKDALAWIGAETMQAIGALIQKPQERSDQIVAVS
jgi:1-acyl-sn-glycerol-3-phosphate acyltransferase